MASDEMPSAQPPAASAERSPVDSTALVPAPPQLPAVQPKPTRPRTRWLPLALVAAVAIGASTGGYLWWRHNQLRLPPSIVWGNGRIEADEIDIDTKYAARIAEIRADEGDMVKAGQVVARMDTRDLEASLKKSEAQVKQAQKAVDEANANVAQLTAQAILAQQEMERTKYTVARGAETRELLDQRQQQLDAANAALEAAKHRVMETEHALTAATHDVELYNVQIADDTLVAPRDGRIQYRLANVGEVLPAGGKVFAMLDILYVYMDIYLPTREAGKVRFGADSRIVLDAYPNVAIPAKVSFVATQAQFTPKTVETAEEREKLMFRIRVKIDPERLRARGDAVRSGLPGIAYIRTDPAIPWPASLPQVAAP